MNEETRTVPIDVTFAPDDQDEEKKIEDHVREFAEGGSIKKIHERGAIGFESIILGTIAVSYLVDLIIKISREWKPGIIVDFCGQNVKIEKSSDLGSGVILIHHKEGTSTMVERQEIEKLSSTIASAIKAFASE